jgi:Cu(I)/Ag(I) efflux system membrane protein CusA/SilA
MVEKIIELCARNRLVVLLGVGFALIGSLVAIKKTRLDAIPDLSDPQVIVFTEWMGRSPTLVEDQVTYPIVSKLIGTPHVTDVRGFSMFGMSFVYAVFEEGTDIYWARSRVLEYMNGLRGALPEGATPALGPDATGIGWVLQYTLTDKTGTHGLDDLRTFQDFTLRYALGSVPGVAEVASVGGYQKQYQVTVDPSRLRAYGVTLSEVIDAIRQSNNDVGGRILEFSGREYYVRGRGYIKDLASIEKIAVRASAANGTPLLIKDLATVRFGPDIRRGLLEWNGEGEAVGGIVVMRYGENALDVIERVKKKFAELQPSFPGGVEMTIAYDRSGIIARSIETLKHALTEEAIVVSVVIMLFLLHFRSSLLPILSLPISVALSFIPMALLDIPSTIMSLGGIAIAIGATVDAQIVMIEAAHKKLEGFPSSGSRADRQRILIEAAKEVTPAIFFSLLIIAVAFLPVFTLNGQAGRLFKPLAYTKTFVMLISALLSITFAPALQELFIRGKIRPEKQHPISRFLIRLYEPFVYVALRRPKSTIAIGLFAMASAIPVAMRLGNEFMPPLNEGDLLYMPITFPNISIEEAKRQLQYQDRMLRSFPEVVTVFGKVGRAESATDPAPITMVETTVQLRPPNEWRKTHHERWYSRWAPGWLRPVFRPFWPEDKPLTWDELTAEMNGKMQFAGWTNAWTMPIKTRVDMLTTGVRTPIGIKVFGADLNEVERIGVSLEHLLAPIKGTRSVLYERNLGGLYLDIIPKPDELARYGLRVADVERVVESAIGGTPIGTTIEGRNRFSISVRYPQDLRSDLESLRNVLIPIGGSGSGGSMGGGAAPMGTQGALETPRGDAAFAFAGAVGSPRPVFLAQNMDAMGSGSASGSGAGMARPRLPSGSGAMSDVPSMAPMLPMGSSGSMTATPGGGMAPAAPGTPPSFSAAGRQAFVPLGQVADIKVAGGPPMVRDEAGLLVGYVYVDIDQAQRDIGGYVNDAKAVVARGLESGELKLPGGYYLKWTGQYEQLAQMLARMKIVIPVTLLLIALLLFLQFRNFVEVLIVLLSIPFALIGSAWLLWLLDYRLSTAVWVGIIALVGLAAQTGIVMIVYIDHAFQRRKAAGQINNLDDIVAAHMEGTVQRVRPKLMTVSTMLIGLVPLLWATSSGADVMKRIAAPMVGGLLTSAFLTLELIPVIVTYWRQEQLLWERLQPIGPALLRRLKSDALVVAIGAALAIVLSLTSLYLTFPGRSFVAGVVLAGVIFLGGVAAYVLHRPAARHMVWPREGAAASPIAD